MTGDTDSYTIYIPEIPAEVCGDIVECKVIGNIQTPYKSMDQCPSRHNQNELQPCQISLCPEFSGGIVGISVGDQLLILYWLHLAKRDMVQLPERPGGRTKPIGVFSTRTPPRPNPIAAAIVEVLDTHAFGLKVIGLDCLDGTPLLDIKKARFYRQSSTDAGLS